MSVGALIVYAAPAAQANVSLSDSSGTLGAGALVTATSTNLKGQQVGGLLYSCAKVTLHFEVVSTTGSHVELEQTQNGSFIGCLAAGVLPITMDNSGVTGNLTINTWGTGNVGLTYISTVFQDAGHTKLAAAPCDYAGTLHVVGWGSGKDEIGVTKSKLTAASCLEANIEGTFTLETPDGTPVNLNYVNTG